MKRLISVVLLAAVILTACGSAVSEAPTETPLYRDPAQPVAARVADLLARMTLEEKIGQMTQVEKNSLPVGAVADYFIGSVLSGGGGSPSSNTPEGWAAMVDGFQEQALSTRLGIPILYGVDAVHGHGNLAGATIFPHNIGLGATRNPDLVRQIGQATAEEMLATGIPWNFGPVVAVVQDVRWGRTYEGYSEDTGLVTELSVAYLEGLQTLPSGYVPAPGQTCLVAATAKHYIGDGGTLFGSDSPSGYLIDQADMQVDEATLRALYLPPYQAAVEAGALSVMVSFSSWNGTRMHANQYLITDVLKGELGFEGFVVSDWAGIDQIPGDYYSDVVTSINAGVDMVMVPQGFQLFLFSLTAAVENGDVSMARIDDAVSRILWAKFLLGLFDHPYSDPAYLATVRSPEHLALARQAVHESLVLLKNENQALPVDRNAGLILVAGEGADNTGLQSGGWTLEWQGVSSSRVEGSTILDGIEALAGPESEVHYNRFGRFDTLEGVIAPVGIVVVSENPYAEGVGDSPGLQLSQTEINAIVNLRPQVEILIVVILSGRPVIITDQYPLADAWVAAWLPGSEGAAVADVLFGEVPFTGRLPYTWPRSSAQLPLNINTVGELRGCDGPLFPFGYGLGEAASEPIEWLECPAIP
ncbi:MAG: glycoside hydrolase family 3 C-terminal domain-containing protein [Anaerolineales bacterium]|nr:glycoside hydrolase family 3 C-terminal domain-containing protein [Anaerolineales bacterium]